MSAFTNISSNLKPALDYLKRHVGQEAVSNQRLLLLLGAMAALLLLSAIYGLWNATTSMGRQVNASKASLARLQAEVTDDAWPKRVQESQSLRAVLGDRLWDAATPGLAEASFENWLRAQFAKYKTEPQQIQITRSPAVGRDGQTPASLVGVQRMTAKVLAPFDQTTLVQVLADVAQADKIVIVDRLIVRAATNSRLEMDISTFIRTADQRPEATGNGAKRKP